MVTPSVRRLVGLCLTAMVLVFTSQAAQVVAQGQQVDPNAMATQEAILKALTVENLIGNAVSLSNQEYPDVEKAIQRFKNGDTQGAKEFLEIAKQKYPKLPPVDLILAKLQVIARNGPAARVYLEQTVTDNAADPEAYLILGDIAFTEGRTTEANALFEKAQALSQAFKDNEKRKQDFEIRVLAGLSAVKEKRQLWEEAQALLTKWVELNPDSSAAHLRLGNTQFRLKKPTEAFEEFKKARDLQPDSAHPYILLGQLYTQDKQIDKARTSFERAYAEEKANEATATAYAEWLIQQNNLDKAQEVVTAMREAKPDSVTALLLDGVVAKLRRQAKAAEDALVKVLTIEPGNAGATNLLALILSESDKSADQDKALGYAQVNARQFPNAPQASVTLAWVLHRMGRTNEALQVLGRVAQTNLNADSAYLVARILVDQGRKENAQQVLEQVLKQAGTGMFLYRRDAEDLLKELKASAPAEPAGDATPASPVGTTPPATEPSTTAPPAGTTPAPAGKSP